MKAKIFKGWNHIQQGIDINVWLEENSNIIIQNILQSSAGNEGNIYTIITIFYSEFAFEKIK